MHIRLYQKYWGEWDRQPGPGRWGMQYGLKCTWAQTEGKALTKIEKELHRQNLITKRMTFKFSLLKKNCHFCHKYLDQWTTDPPEAYMQMLHTYRTGSILANTRPHQLCCSWATCKTCTTTRLFASVTCKAFGNNLPPAVMQAQVFMYTCRVWQII